MAGKPPHEYIALKPILILLEIGRYAYITRCCWPSGYTISFLSFPLYNWIFHANCFPLSYSCI